MYKWEGMTKISYEEALERFRNNQEVFVLYDDDSEALAEEESKIHEHHEYGGEFGHD